MYALAAAIVIWAYARYRSRQLYQKNIDLENKIKERTTELSKTLEDLKSALDWNEMKPDFGFAPTDDPITALAAASSDGKGLEILAVLAEILEMQPAALPLGKDLENNLIYVWPYLAETPIESLTAAEEVDLYRLVSGAKVAEMREKKRWTWWRLVIGADGTWQSFKKPD